MSFKFNQDRGTILRITFDIVYPNGQMKTVAMNMADYDEFKDIALIALNEEGVKDFIAPILASKLGQKAGDDAVLIYNTVEEDADMKPAMLIVSKNGEITVKCGKHRSRGHYEKDNPVTRYM